MGGLQEHNDFPLVPSWCDESENVRRGFTRVLTGVMSSHEHVAEGVRRKFQVLGPVQCSAVTAVFPASNAQNRNRHSTDDSIAVYPKVSAVRVAI